MSELSFYNQNKFSILRLRDITCIVVAITIFLSIDPYFVWSSFGAGIGQKCFKVLQILSIVLLISQLKWDKMPISAFLCGLCILAIFFFYCFFTGVKSGTTHPLLIGNILVYLFYALNVMSDRDILLKSFALFRKFFAVILSYTLIIHILLLCNINVPYSVLQSGEAGRVEFGEQFYHNYFGCLLINHKGDLLYRFTSVFTEPGVIGTFCAFLLTANDFNVIKSKCDKIFLISGILSFSVAFYVMAVFAYIMKVFRKGGYKRLIGIIIIIVLYYVFQSIKFSNEMLVLLQERLTTTKNGLAGDNRVKEAAEASYQTFLKSDLKTVLFGYGKPDSLSDIKAWQAAASYKESIYWLGILGYGIMIAWFIATPLVCYKSKSKTKNVLMYSYIIIFLLSQYQRPYMKTLFLVYILLAGCLYIQQSVDRNT